MKHYLFVLILLTALPAIGQNNLQIEQELDFKELKTGRAKTIQLNISPTDFFITREHNYSYQASILLKNVPDSLAKKSNFALHGEDFFKSDPATTPGFTNLSFTFDLVPSMPSQDASWNRGGLDTLRFLLPIASAPVSPFQAQSLQVDFCPDGPAPEYAYGRKWAYVWPNEAVSMVVRHVNPLKYTTTLESADVALNTDAGVALSAVSGILNPNGASFKAESVRLALESSRKIDPNVTELERIAFIAVSIEQLLNSLKQKECLSDADISLLRTKKTSYDGYLVKTPDAISLKAKLNMLSFAVSSLTTDAISTTSSVSSTTTSAVSSTAHSTTTVAAPISITTTVSSLTTSNATSYSTSADADARDSYKQYLRMLAGYAKDEQLAQRTFEQIERLKDVIDGTTVQLRPILLKAHVDADAIRLTLTTNPTANTTATPVKQIYDVWVVGRLKLDFSAGIIRTGLVDQVYTTRDTTFVQSSVKDNNTVTNSVTRQIPVSENSDRFSLALVTLAHYYCRLPCFRGSINLGATVGGGITQKGKPIALAGFSLLLGRQQRWIINTGWSFGTQQELSNRYAKTANYINSEPPATLAYVSRMAVKGFIGLSFNWGKNEKIVGPDGVEIK